jgi:hypothetical protein
MAQKGLKSVQNIEQKHIFLTRSFLKNRGNRIVFLKALGESYRSEILLR